MQTALPRMRTIKEAVEELKAIDEKTAIREYYIRDLVNRNEIKYIRAGRKILINFDAFLEYLQAPPSTDEGIEDNSHGRKTNKLNFRGI